MSTKEAAAIPFIALLEGLTGRTSVSCLGKRSMAVLAAPAILTAGRYRMLPQGHEQTLSFDRDQME